MLDRSDLPPPSSAEFGVDSRPFTLGPGDKIGISVLGIEELNRKEIQVDASGRVAVALLGALDASGKTPAQLAEEIQSGYRRYIRNPEVSVDLIETASTSVSVDGEVKEPGIYPIVGKMTLMRAVAVAKGPTEFAKLQSVVVFRTVGEERLAALYDLAAIRQGAYADPQIYPNDIVLVGNSPAKRLFKDILQITPLITTPIVTVLATRGR